MKKNKKTLKGGAALRPNENRKSQSRRNFQNSERKLARRRSYKRNLPNVRAQAEGAAEAEGAAGAGAAAAELQPIGKPRFYQYDGSYKRVYFDEGDTYAFVSSTKQKMLDAGLNNKYLQEELRLTQIEHGLFPTLVLNAEELTPEDKPKIIKRRTYLGEEIFTYKKLLATPVFHNSPGIFDFIVDSIEELAEGRDRPCFVNLDIKSQNIGLVDEKYIYFDNGISTFYPVPPEFKKYYKLASLILAICKLRKHLTAKDLEKLSDYFTEYGGDAEEDEGHAGDKIRTIFERKLSREQEERIKRYVQDFLLHHGLTEIEQKLRRTKLRYPYELMTIHCVLDLEPNVGHEGRFERFIEFAQEYGLGT